MVQPPPLSQTPTERDKNFSFGFSISFVTVNGLLHGPVAVTDSLIGPYFVPNLFFSSFICFAPFTENEGPMRIQYKCLVPIYIFPEMKLCSLLISKKEL